MGELLLCRHSIAAMPYYLEILSLNIYSLEELVYVIEHHPLLVDEGFFEEELLLWIEHEVGEGKLAEDLRESLQKEQGITRLVELVLNATGYLSYETGIRVVSQIREMQYKSVFERRKIRADRYVESKKYITALSEYRRLLQMEDECRKNPVMCGKIWHNQGTVFARLFLFKEAGECFEKAYQYHMNPESIYEAMTACICLGEKERAAELAQKYGLNEQRMKEILEEIECINQSEEAVEQEEKVELRQQLSEWKAEYQKTCG